MQVKINIKPENEAMFIQALNDSNIPYWIEENEQIVTQDVSSDEAAAWKNYWESNSDTILAADSQPKEVIAFLKGCQHVRNQLSKEYPLK